MFIFGNKRLEDLQKEDISNLIAAQEEECIILEYKRELTKRTDTDKKEIAKDVSAMANSEGGIIIYGLEEDSQGKPISINWIDNSENFQETFEEIVSRTILDRAYFKIQPIPNPDDASKKIYVVLIPKSLKLHMVIKNHDNRYYKRIGRTIQQMEHSEIQERTRKIVENERLREDYIIELENDFCKCFNPDLENNHHFGFILEPELISSVVDQPSLMEIINSVKPHPVTGRPANAYKSSILISYDFLSSSFHYKLMIIHPDGTIELRMTGNHVEPFTSAYFSQLLAVMVWWGLKIYEKLNYYGSLKLHLNLKKGYQFRANPTWGNTQGLYLFRGGDDIKETVTLPSLTTVTETEIKTKILELIKIIGSYANITGNGAYENIEDMFKKKSLQELENQL